MSHMNGPMGVSRCASGEERYEFFTVSDPVVRRRDGGERVQYDYRTPEGKLFSTVAKTLEICRERRDAWLQEQATK